MAEKVKTRSMFYNPDAELWRLPAITPPEEPEDISTDLSRKGWSLVRIDRIAREPVVIAYSRELAGLPSGYAVYTAEELERIARVPDAGHTVALIHAAKKFGAVLITEDESL